MERNNRQKFNNIIKDQDLALPVHIENAISDPDVIETFDNAFPETGIYHVEYGIFANFLQARYGIKVNEPAERSLVIDLLKQKRMDSSLRGVLDG